MKILDYKKIEGVKIFEPDVYTDFRGDLWTLWKEDEFPLDIHFNHDKLSTSRKNTLRGIHGDFKTHKLVYCPYGELYFVFVDNRKKSKTYMQWDYEILDDKSRKIAVIPPGVGTSFLVMSEHSVFGYKWSYTGEYPDVEDQFSIKWNDPRIDIHWPIENPILSERDA